MDNLNNFARAPGIRRCKIILIIKSLIIIKVDIKKKRTMPKKNRQRSDPVENHDNKCVFCETSEDNELKYGKMYQHEGILTHYYCLLLSSNMQQKGNDDEGILGFLKIDILNELKRGKRLVCSYCKKKGATLGCCNTKCKKIFHLPCGLEAGSFHQFFGEFRSYCVTHRPKQKIDDKIRTQQPEQILCYICYDNVDRNNLLETLWAPCCKKNAWFHRNCVQQLAMSAGYFFKCPLCNNKKEFQKSMLDNGIFIPCQDASWELVPNAFEELLYRHNRCDATQCICTKGRRYISSNPKWELVLCRTCGSQGIHAACGGLKWLNPTWECNECTSILNKSMQDDHSNSLLSLNHSNSHIDSHTCSNDAESSDQSDSDISVGVEEPIHLEQPTPWPTISQSQPQQQISMRPGPRSFKLRQERIMRQSSNTFGPDSANTSSDSKYCHTQTEEIIPSDVVVLDDEEDVTTCDNRQPSETTYLDNSLNTGLSTPMIGHIAVGSVDNPTIIAEVQMPTHLYPLPSSSDADSVMQIKISNVTSLPPDTFGEPPMSEITEDSIIEVDSENEEINYHLSTQRLNTSSPTLARRDSNLTASSNEPKKPRLSCQHTCTNNGGGISLENAAIVNVMGKEYVVPLVQADGTCIRESDGDAGSRPAVAMQSAEEFSECRNSRDRSMRIQYQPAASDEFYQPNERKATGTTPHNPNRLKVDKIPMRKLKFHLSGENTVKMTVYDMFTMSLDVDTGSNIRNGLNGSSVLRRFSSSCVSNQAEVNNFKKSINNPLKWSDELARKENVAPTTTNTNGCSTNQLERKFKRQRTDSFICKNNSNSSINTLHKATSDNPGTSRDGLREISHTFNNWQNELPTKCDTTDYARFHWNNSLSTETKKTSIYRNLDNFHISIDLSRIQPLLLSEPNLFRRNETDPMVIKKFNTFGSLSDLKTSSSSRTIENYVSNESFRRSKSLENLSATFAFKNHNEYRSCFEKRGQKRKRKFSDKPD